MNTGNLDIAQEIIQQEKEKIADSNRQDENDRKIS